METNTTKTCNCYEEGKRSVPVYNIFNGSVYKYREQKYAVCNGTKERDECDCGGDRSKCNFYETVRTAAAIESKDYQLNMIVDAINSYFGCDAAYYDVDAYALALCLYDHGVRVAGDNVDGKSR